MDITVEARGLLHQAMDADVRSSRLKDYNLQSPIVGLSSVLNEPIRHVVCACVLDRAKSIPGVVPLNELETFNSLLQVYEVLLVD